MSIPPRLALSHLIIGSLIVIGTALSIKDYRDWRRAEKANYGRGSVETQAYKDAENLVGPYINEVAKMRLRYPDGWEVIENQNFKKQDTKTPFNFMDGKEYEIVRIKDQFGRALVKVAVQADGRDLINIADAVAVGVNKDREYLTVNEASMTILTWMGDKEVTQKVLAKKGSRLYKVEITCEISAWPTLAKTFWEMYKSWILI